MADLRKGKKPDSLGVAPAGGPDEGRPATPVDKPEPKPRLSFNLTDEGRPDFDKMQAGTKASLVKILQDPDTSRRLGLAPSSAAATTPAETQAMMVMLAGNLTIVVGMAEAIALKKLGVADDIIKTIAPLNETEAAAIIGPTTRLVEKYAGGSLSRWGDEIALALALTTTTISKISTARQLMAERAKVPARPATTPPPDAASVLTLHDAGPIQ